MARGKRYTPELSANLLQQIDAAVTNGKARPTACEECGISEATYNRWRRKYAAVTVDLTSRLQKLEQENANLRRLVAQLSLEKLLLKDMASRNF